MPGKKTKHQDISIVDSLYRISGLVGKTEDPKEALALILTEIVACVRAHSGSIALINPDTGNLAIEVSTGFPEGEPLPELKTGQGITGWVALHGKPALVPDVSQDSRYIKLKDGIRSEMAAPMEDRGAVTGVVNLDSERLHAFDEEDLKILILLTAEAAKVAKSLWLIKQLKRQALQLESLVTIGRRLVSKLDMQALLDTLTVEARRIMECKFCSLFLLQPESDVLVQQSSCGAVRESSTCMEVPMDESSFGVAVRRKKQVEIYDLRKTEDNLDLLEMTHAEGLASSLCTPIICEGETIGVLNAYTERLHRFNNDEKRLFSTVASLGAVAIQNARLYARVFETEDHLRRNERLTTLGLLAAEIAHEIRNPLTVLKLLFDSLGLDFPDADPRNKDQQVIGEKIDQLESIVERVLSFAKSSENMFSRWDIADIIGDTLLLVRLKLAQGNIEAHFDRGPCPLHVKGNKGQLQQVMLNLLLNAANAMPEGGTIRITTGREQNRGQTQAVIQIRDTGAGIPPAMQERIFESFLTGRQDGTGLGLAIVKRIMESHHGTIGVVATGKSGTTIELRLPAS